DEVVEDLARGLVRVLLRHGAEGGEVGAGLVRAQAVTTVSLLDHPRRQEDLLTKAIDRDVTRPRVPASFRIAQGLRPLALRDERLHRPFLVGPDHAVAGNEIDDLVIAPSAEKRAQTHGRSVEVPA